MTATTVTAAFEIAEFESYKMIRVTDPEVIKPRAKRT